MHDELTRTALVDVLFGWLATFQAFQIAWMLAVSSGRLAARFFVYLGVGDGKEAMMSDHFDAGAVLRVHRPGGWLGPAGWHLQSCSECLFELDFLLLAELAATPEEELVLEQMPNA